MCGISGIFNWNKKEEISRNILDNMLEKIKHRGPDGKDMYVDDCVGLGFNLAFWILMVVCSLFPMKITVL